MSLIGIPPAPDCGAMSPLTLLTRPHPLLNAERARAARRLKRQGHDVPAIALALAVPEPAVLEALASMRMANTNASRATLNVTFATQEFVMQERQHCEPVWQVAGRLLTELIVLRAEV